MKLKSLSIVNFKSHLEANYSFSKRIVCFTGNNGAGKTNLLDAIHYLSFCKSYFNAIDSQNIHHEQNFFVIQGFYDHNDGESELYCGVKQGDKKRFKINKKDYQKLSDHIGKFPAVMISPYDRDLIGDGSDVRRKLMDSIISQLDKEYLQTLISYNRVLAQRNALIKHMAAERKINQSNLEIWDIQLAELATNIRQKRLNFLEDFVQLFNDYYRFISGSEEQVSVEFLDSVNGEDYTESLNANFKRDMALEYTSVGAHKDDLIFLIEGKPIKKFGSQGQQKSYLVALKLAQYEFLKRKSGKKPILLMDDVFDKLDQQRVSNILKLVHDDVFGQVFITDTDSSRLEKLFKENELNAEIFEIKKQTVEQESIR
ncbi:MAG: DNA replication/repair protein RecF [Bacteroidia bacterium]